MYRCSTLTPSLAACLWLLAGTASAQNTLLVVRPPTTTFEGNSGTTTLTFPLESLTGPPPATISGTVSTFTSGLLSPATGGAACGTTGIDFQNVNRSFTIAAGSTAPVSVQVVVCGDVAVESSERVALRLANLVNAECAEGCAAIGFISNDDGPPRVTIADLSTAEPLFNTKVASFIVSLSHPSTANTSVQFATRNGTAVAKGTAASPDYLATSGTLTIPAGALTGSIPVTILADAISESDQTFFMDLSGPAPTGVTITDASAVGTIRDSTITFTGTFDVSTAADRTSVDTPQIFRAVWEVPTPLVWRNLKTIDFRIRGPQSTVIWLRWDEPTDAFSLCGIDDTWGRSVVSGDACGDGRLPGTPGVLETPFAQLDLAGTRVTGSGPTGQTVTLTLPITFTQACGDCEIELAATSDAGAFDDFASAGRLKILGRGAPK